MAYNIYVATVMTFLLQLDRLPQAWPRTDAAALRCLAPGPGNWVMPMDLHALRDSLGLPQQFTKLEEVDLAAKFRVARREAWESCASTIRLGSWIRRTRHPRSWRG